MPAKDTSEIKKRMLFVLEQRGPSLPVHIARGTGLSILFASAFLSELLSERKIKMSDMKVGSSPIYYIPGQEPQIENFSNHLNSKEKEAFTLLQNKRILKDTEQAPAIRVALRSIKDFAVPFKKEDKIFWRYYLIPESELQEKKVDSPKPPKKIVSELTTQDKTSEKKEPTSEEEALNIFEKPKSIVKKVKKISKNNDKFFNKVKAFLSGKSTEILDIESFNKNELVLKIKKDDKEEILIAYNKKRIDEEDIIKAHKKISGKYQQYKILCLGEPIKRTKNIINAVKDLKGIDRINDD